MIYQAAPPHIGVDKKICSNSFVCHFIINFISKWGEEFQSRPNFLKIFLETGNRDLMFDHILCLEFSNSIILISSLTEFAQHIKNLTALQALFERWPILIKDKMYIIIYINSGWLTNFNGMRLYCEQQLCYLVSYIGEFHARRVHFLAVLRVNILFCFLSLC